MTKLSLEDLLLYTQLESVLFERSSFDVLMRPTSNTKGTFEISAPLELSPHPAEGGGIRVLATIDGYMKGFVVPEKNADTDNQVFDASFRVAANFWCTRNTFTTKDFQALVEEKHRATVSFFIGQIYPYIRHHVRIRLVESGFKGVEPAYHVLTSADEDKPGSYEFQKKKQTSKKKRAKSGR